MYRGEVWSVDLEPVEGDEMCKMRPVVIVSADSIGLLRLKVVVPVTGWDSRYSRCPWMVQIQPTFSNGLSKPSAVDCYQVRSLSEERFERRLGAVSSEELEDIIAAIQIVIGV